ncbi:MAG: penicillin-binding protein activator, partial [Alphaproteobacteria bacterium]|nr:penicillin-binding protein activator [Alphaproteobacteria bacterium]
EGGAGGAAELRAPEEAASAAVALLLPLTGARAELGAALLDAAQLALFDLADDRLVLRPYDTGDTAPGAAAAAERALAEGAMLILGPVFSAATMAAAEPARARGVSLIAFSNDRSAAGPGVFLMGFSPDQQVARVLHFARERGLRRIAALVPQTGYGAEVSLALARAAAPLGLSAEDIVQYAADASDGDAAARALAQRRARFDAVLLPEGGPNLRQLAPLLPYYDVDPAAYRFLGTYLWLDATLGREPALVGGWFAAPALERHDAFRQRFAAAFGHEPPRLASVAYDAMALAIALARRGDFSSAMLTNASGFKGVDGIFRFGPDGIAERGLAVIEVTANGLTVVSPAPNTFQELTQ